MNEHRMPRPVARVQSWFRRDVQDKLQGTVGGPPGCG
jgi:hypothetical protein